MPASPPINPVGLSDSPADVAALGRQIRQRDVSPLHVAKQCVAGRRNHDAKCNAYHLTDDEALLTAARTLVIGDDPFPLAGLCMSVKSAIAVEGFPCFAGCSTALPSSRFSQGSFISALRDQGVLISGITHASELCVGGLGANPHWGTPRNPWDSNQHRIPGGSSAGAAISVLEGSCQFALGTDTGGSVRVPASLAGICGLKVTTGRWPVDGVVPLASRYDSIGVLAHSVRDVQAIYHATDSLFHPVQSSAYTSLSAVDFRLASGRCWEDLDPGMAEVLSGAIDQLNQAGAVVGSDDEDLFLQTELLREGGPNTAAYEVRHLIRSLDENGGQYYEQLSAHVREFIDVSESVSAQQYELRLATVSRFRQKMDDLIDERTVYLMPTIKVTPPTLEQLQNRDVEVHYSDAILHNTVLPSINNYCALTLPVGLDRAGMPVGLQLAAKGGNERYLLEVAADIEAVLGNSQSLLGTAPLLS